MKTVLSIAGSDSSGGAGIQADLKTFEAFGVFGTTAITVLTAQNTTGVTKIVPVDASFVKQQIETVMEDFEIAAIKIGMLFNKDIIDTVYDIIKELNIPIVLDPVAVSKAGSPLLEKEAVEAMKKLFDHVTLITPNRFEAQEFFGYVEGKKASLDKIHTLNTPVLIKHMEVTSDGVKQSVDQLYFRKQKKLYISPAIKTTNLHGTGCSYSSAITANLALGYTLDESIQNAKTFIVHALVNAPKIGNGPGPIHHKEGGKNVVLT